MKQTDLEFIKALLIRIGFMDTTNFSDLRHKDNTFFSLVDEERRNQICLSITYKQEEYNNDLYVFFNEKEKRLKNEHTRKNKGN